VHILGGNDQTPETDRTMIDYYAVPHHFKVEIGSQSDEKLVVQRKADMMKPRQAFGICAMNNYIYIGGGVRTKDIFIKSVERYDLLKDQWEALPQCDFPKRIFGMTFLAVRRRYIYSFGEAGESTRSSEEPFYKLDTLNLAIGW
jgi:hypothetical protein